MADRRKTKDQLLNKRLSRGRQRSLAGREDADHMERYRALVQLSPDATMLLDLNLNILAANPQAAHLVGADNEANIIGKTFLDFVPPHHHQRIHEIARMVIDKGNVRDIDCAIVGWDDSSIVAEFSVSVVSDPNGRQQSFIAIVRDITNRKRAEEALRNSEIRFRAIFNSMFQFIGLLRPDGSVIEANQTALDFAGMRHEDVVGKPFWQCDWWKVSSETQDEIRNAVARASAGEFVRFDTPIFGKDGASAIIDFSMKPVKDDAGNTLLLIPEGRDVTEERDASTAIEKLRRQNELILNSAAEGILVLDLQGKHIFVNPAAAKMLGYAVDELIGEHSHSIWHHTTGDGSVSPEAECPIYATLKDGRVHHNVRDDVFWRKDGTSFSVAYSSTPLIDNGEIVGAVVNFRDITERNEAVEKLRQSEHFARRIVETSPNIVYIYDLLEHNNVYTNRKVLDILGYSPEQVQEIGTQLFDAILHPEDREYVTEHHRRLNTAKDGEIYEAEYRMKRANGEWLWLLSRDTIFTRGENGFARQILGIAQDITERKLADVRLRRQLDRLEALRDIDKAITGSFDIRLTLKVVLEEVINQLHVDAADVLLFNRHLNTLDFVAGQGFHTNALKQTRLPFGKGHAGQAAIEQKVIYIPDLSESPGHFLQSPLFAKENFVSYFAAPLTSKGMLKGVLEIFHRSTCEEDAEWFDFLEALTTQAAIAVDDAEMFSNLQRSNLDLIMAYDATIDGWARALDYRDKETEGHSRRVTEMTVKIAQAMGIGDAEIIHVRRGALLHDIGKMGIRDNILLKPGKLTAEEWEIMRKHPVIAYEMLSPIDFLRQALDIPYCHHEKWDGTGYPRGLKGEQIPLSARIFSVVDVWDALRSDRPYRPAWPRDKTLEYIQQQVVKAFAPDVITVFLRILEELEESGIAS